MQGSHVKTRGFLAVPTGAAEDDAGGEDDDDFLGTALLLAGCAATSQGGGVVAAQAALLPRFLDGLSSWGSLRKKLRVGAACVGLDLGATAPRPPPEAPTSKDPGVLFQRCGGP